MFRTSTNRFAVNWERTFEILYGHPADKAEPKHLGVFRKLATDLAATLAKRDREIIRQVVIEARLVGLKSYLQYVFYLLMEHSQHWPHLSSEKKDALLAIQEILVQSGNVPTYTDGLTMPPEGLEAAADEALNKIATWGVQILSTSIYKEYKNLVRKYSPSILKNIYNETSGLSKEDFVATWFESTLDASPMALPHGHYLSSVFSRLFG